MGLTDALGGPQGDQVQVALLIHDEVVGLQVPHHYFFSHEVLEQADHAGYVELTVQSAKQPDFSDHVVERLALNVLADNHAVGAVVLQGLEEQGQERVLAVLHHLQLLLQNGQGVLLLGFGQFEQLAYQFFIAASDKVIRAEWAVSYLGNVAKGVYRNVF